MPKTAEYGFWKSPITSDLIVQEAVRLAAPRLDGEDVYWIEGRPAERGRYVLVRGGASGHEAVDLTPAPFNVRSRVHEYGGGAYAVRGGAVFFSNYDDQRLYRVSDGQPPLPITPENSCRYVDSDVSRSGDLLVTVREDHSQPDTEAVNTIVAIGLAAPHEQTVLVSGSDFYSNPRFSPDGKRLSWMSWNHPHMPWERSELWTADLGTGPALANHRKIAAGERESIYQPEWSPDGTLYFVSDRSEWWNLYRSVGDAIEPLAEMDAEFGLPQWIFDVPTYDFTSDGRIVCTYTQQGRWNLATIDTASRVIENIDVPYTSISNLRAAGNRVVFEAGSTTEPPSIVELNLANGSLKTIRRAFTVQPEIEKYYSIPEAIEFDTENNQTAHAFFYLPRNPDFEAPADERPPLIVECHGGPTGSTSSTLDLKTQYWTSRGFAVLDVNYGGSTGYGRAYRERLFGQWGVVDVDDCVNGAQSLVRQDLVDGERLIIKGGSAGGYTTLAALTFRDVFKAGASHYGVSDLEALALETHKFESRYLDSVVGPYPTRRDVYLERSPIHHVESLSAPVIFFQGSEDKVVPPSQAERMLEALRKKGVPASYVLFEGEQHGFRAADNIKYSLDAELFFYAIVLLRKGVRF
ncbi:MAG: S9 family peptidase [Acidobacteria bacterium]|nr:S9 family peptidase [Acidobacteriota bacterium]